MDPLHLTLEQRAALRAEVRARAHALRREAIARLVDSAGAALRRLLHLQPQRRMTERTHA